MSHLFEIQHSYNGNSCELKLLTKTSACKPGRSIQNTRNCDIFIDENDFLIYMDVHLYKFHSIRRFDLKDLKNIHLNYNTNQHTLDVTLPCLPLDEEIYDGADTIETSTHLPERSLDLWKLKRITDNCLLRINDNPVLLRPQASYDFGFASKFRGRIKTFETTLKNITRIPEPCDVSPLQRSIDREIDEMKCFSGEQYQLNFIELQVPDGLENPMLYTFNFKDSALDSKEEQLLHNIISKKEVYPMPDEYNISEIDNGLLIILMAICYDLRFTAGASNCESGWTRSVLAPTLSYFEPFASIKDVVICFLRRSLIYPLYRNYELSRQCVEDCVLAMQINPKWIIKQLLISHEIFETSDREMFNFYYIEDYIRYLSDEVLCPPIHLQTLACNLKNILLDITKKHLRLGLKELETELLKELINEIHMHALTSDDEDGNYEDTDSDDDCTTESSEDSSSDSSEDSVIDRKLSNALKSL